MTHVDWYNPARRQPHWSLLRLQVHSYIKLNMLQLPRRWPDMRASLLDGFATWILCRDALADTCWREGHNQTYERLAACLAARLAPRLPRRLRLNPSERRETPHCIPSSLSLQMRKQESMKRLKPHNAYLAYNRGFVPQHVQTHAAGNDKNPSSNGQNMVYSTDANYHDLVFLRYSAVQLRCHT